VDSTSKWFLDMVEITNDSSGKTAYFVCRRWLERRNSYEVTLQASSSNLRLEEVEYKVITVTRSLAAAGLAERLGAGWAASCYSAWPSMLEMP
jgi:hypothetical protein